MDRQLTALVAHVARWASRQVCAFPKGVLLFGIASVFAVFLWVVSVAPPLVSAALTVAVAIAWCLWLERHPDAAEAGSSRQTRDCLLDGVCSEKRRRLRDDPARKTS